MDHSQLQLLLHKEQSSLLNHLMVSISMLEPWNKPKKKPKFDYKENKVVQTVNYPHHSMDSANCFQQTPSVNIIWDTYKS